MSRYPKQTEGEDGWTGWIMPAANYRMACCDCSLVHDMQFEAVKEEPDENAPSGHSAVSEHIAGAKVIFRARRNNRATAAHRRQRRSD